MSDNRRYNAEVLRALRAREPDWDIPDEELLRASEGSVWRACFEFGLMLRDLVQPLSLEPLLRWMTAHPRLARVLASLFALLAVLLIFAAPRSIQ